MTSPAFIREATPADSAEILDCLREAFEPYRSAYTPGAFTDTILTSESLAHRFTEMTVLIATTPDGAVIGTIAASSGNNEGHLRGMAVRASWQSRGIAHQLLASAESLLCARGCHRVTLDTTQPLARAIAFYKKHGYQPTGRVQDFYGMPLFEFAKNLMPGP